MNIHFFKTSQKKEGTKGKQKHKVNYLINQQKDLKIYLNRRVRYTRCQNRERERE